MAAIRVPIFEYKQIYREAQEGKELKEVNARLTQEIERLKELLRLERLGRNSWALGDERLGHLKIGPSIEGAEIEQAAVSTEGDRKEPLGGELLRSLPRKEEIKRVQEEERKCPCCGQERQIIGYETQEELDLEPPKYFVRIIKTEKLACDKCPEEGKA